MDVTALNKWARDCANALRIVTGRNIEIPPYAMPRVLADFNAPIPSPEEVAPELLVDWGALIDEMNGAITDAFNANGIPLATFRAEDMPALIMELKPSGIEWDGVLSVYPAGSALMCEQSQITLPNNHTLLMCFDPSGLDYSGMGGYPTSVTFVTNVTYTREEINSNALMYYPAYFSTFTYGGDKTITFGSGGGTHIGSQDDYFTIDWTRFSGTSVTGECHLFWKIV